MAYIFMTVADHVQPDEYQGVLRGSERGLAAPPRRCSNTSWRRPSVNLGTTACLRRTSDIARVRV